MIVSPIRQLRRCPSCGVLLEELPALLEEGDYIACGRCGRLYTATRIGLEHVPLEVLDDEFRPFAAELVAVVTRRFWEARIREVLSQPKGAP